MGTMQATSEAVWKALEKAPSPEELKSGPRITLAAKLKPYRYCLEQSQPSLLD